MRALGVGLSVLWTNLRLCDLRNRIHQRGIGVSLAIVSDLLGIGMCRVAIHHGVSGGDVPLLVELGGMSVAG
jgi:hypothetical protein